MRSEKTYMYGKHALTEALRNSPEMLDKVFLAEKPDGELAALLHAAQVPVGRLETLPAGVEKDANHQGYIGEVKLHKLVRDYGDFMSLLEITDDTCLVVLGEVQDPQNVGAIIRTAAAFGIAAVLIPEHNQAQITASVIKVSAGMAFRVPLVSIGNVNATLKDLKERGFWTYGLDGEATKAVGTEVFDSPTVFVLGNESKGIRRKTLEHCDIPLVIPMHPGCESLNVAASAAVALYAWSIKHPGTLK